MKAAGVNGQKPLARSMDKINAILDWVQKGPLAS
jgi:hypothetical protein